MKIFVELCVCTQELHSTQYSYQESWQDIDIDKISLSLFYKITLFHTAVRGEECENRIIFCILPALQMALSLCTGEGRFILECICAVLLMCGGSTHKHRSSEVSEI